MALLNTGATGIVFVDVAMAHYECKMLQILFILLAKPKLIRGFDSQPAPDIIYTICFILTMQGYSELLAPMLMTKLDQYSLILDKP